MSTDAFADFVIGHGELWCAQLLAAACRLEGADAKFMDTREILVRPVAAPMFDRTNGLVESP